MGKRTEYLTNEYIKSINGFIDSNDAYFKFRDAMAKGENRSSVSERYVDKNVDLTWIDKIEDSVIALDSIVRAPRNYIKEVEEIVPIAMSRRITSESIKHLSQHTNMIQNVEGDKITPNKILNVYKEESFATYENRFIKTLLNNLQMFIEKRYLGLNSQKDVNNVNKSRTEQVFSIGNEKIAYAMEISITVPSSTVTERDSIRNQTKKNRQNDIERVEKIRTIVNDFMKSEFMGKMKEAPLVHPPISKTNLLTKNQDYKKALELWQFIESYREAGYEVGLVEDSILPTAEYQEQLNRSAFIEYLLLKRYSGGETDASLGGDYAGDKNTLTRLVDSKGTQGGGRHLKEENTSILKKEFRQILGTYEDNLEEVRNIFVDEIERRSAAIEKQENKISLAIGRCLNKETKMELEEKAKELKRERAKRAKERKLKAIALEKQKARIRKDKERAAKKEAEKKAKEALELKKKQAQAKAKADALKAAELKLKKEKAEYLKKQKAQEAAEKKEAASKTTKKTSTVKTTKK